MTDDPTGLALREHLDEVMRGVTASPALLDSVRANYQRRTHRRTTVLAWGSALTAAAATAAVFVGAMTGPAKHVTGPRPAVQPTPLVTPTPSPTMPSYPPAQPDPRWFANPFGLPRPSGEIARIPLRSEDNDPVGSRRTLLVWYNASKNTFCEHDIVQTERYPEGSDRAGGGGGGGCSATPMALPWRRTQLVTGTESCREDYWPYWLGVVGADAPIVKVHGVPGPNPKVIVQRLQGAPTSFFVAVDATAPVLLFDYLDAQGHLVRQQRQSHHVVPGRPLNCTSLPTPAPTPTPTPSG